jgi:streptomycin 6-kinase
MSQFEKNITNIYGEKGKSWLANLNNQVKQIATVWNLERLQPIEDLSYNYVLQGYQNDLPIILKLSPNYLALTQEMKALRTFAGYGAVAILAETEGALLLQRAIPGKPLKNLPSIGNNRIKVACEVMSRLHRAPFSKDSEFPHIQDWLKTLDQEWDIPPPHLKKARLLKNDLLKRESSAVLLHGDLHQSNILSDGNNWLVIDPKGVIGSPIHEMWAFVEDLSNDLPFISEYFHFDLRDVTQWYYVHLILAACWQVEDHLDPTLFLNLANKISL